jgi:hypothetical protein
MMHNAEDLKLLPPDQAGSRKDHHAEDQGLNKVLTFNLL